MDFKYDLAISLLEEDTQFGWDIVNKLGNIEKIFFYKKDVDELAFKNGVNVFGEVFSKQSRFILVLYRENYGNTDWTGLEYSIIQDRFKRTIKSNDSPILFCKLDKSAKPFWLPETYIYHKINDLDSIVRLLRKKITDQGGISFPQTSEERLKLNILRKKYEEIFKNKSYLSSELANEARSEAAILRNKLYQKLERNAQENGLFFRDNSEHLSSNIPLASFKVQIENIIVSLKDHQVATNAIDGAYVEVIIRNDNRILINYKQEFYMSFEQIRGWRDANQNNFLTTEGFIEIIFQEIVTALLS